MQGLGERIKERRKSLGWTQQTLCDKTGLSKGFLSDVENGKTSVCVDNLVEIAKALSVSVGHLVGEPMNGQTVITDDDIKSIKKLVSLIRSCAALFEEV